jgi:hypothetical protein
VSVALSTRYAVSSLVNILSARKILKPLYLKLLLAYTSAIPISGNHEIFAAATPSAVTHLIQFNSIYIKL